MATYTSYDVVGVKEDISDIITNISPTQTPFLTSIGTEKVTQQLFQWQTDVLRTVQTTTVPEGVDPTDIAPVATSMLSNRTQILMEAVKVSGTLEATSLYGRARESAYQLAKSAAALKRDLEVAFVGTAQTASIGAGGNGAQTGLPALAGAVAPYTTTGSAVARSMAGAQTLIYQGGTATGSAMGGPCVFTTGLAENVPLTLEASTPASATNAYSAGGLLNVLEQIYINGGNPNVILCSPVNALLVAGWGAGATSADTGNVNMAANRTRYLNNDSKGARKLINVIDIYVSPFGEQRVVNDRFLRYKGMALNSVAGPGGTITPVTVSYNNTIIYDPDMFSQVSLRPWTRETLAKTGDSLNMMIVGEFSLKCKAPLSAGVIVDAAGGTAPAGGTF